MDTPSFSKKVWDAIESWFEEPAAKKPRGVNKNSNSNEANPGRGGLFQERLNETRWEQPSKVNSGAYRGSRSNEATGKGSLFAERLEDARWGGKAPVVPVVTPSPAAAVAVVVPAVINTPRPVTPPAVINTPRPVTPSAAMPVVVKPVTATAPPLPTPPSVTTPKGPIATPIPPVVAAVKPAPVVTMPPSIVIPPISVNSALTVDQAKAFVAGQYVTRGDLPTLISAAINSFLQGIGYETGSVSPEVLKMVNGSLIWGPGGGGGGIDFSYFAFGFSISGAVVTFQPGEIHHGTRAVVTVASVQKTITSNLQYVWIEYTFGGSAVFAGPSTTMPVSTETVMKVWLACFNFAGGVATVNLVGHIGNIEIPGAFG